MFFKTSLLLISLLLLGGYSAYAQEEFNEKSVKNSKKKKKVEKFDPKKGFTTGEQVSESVILVYSGLRGRPGLAQIRKTTFETGSIKVIDSNGTISRSNYEQWVLRAEELEKERVRLNRKLPDAEYAMVYDGKKVFGLYNDSAFTPREDALKSFRNRIWHGIEALLRYKESGSEVKLEKSEKILGVELYVVTLTDKEKRVTKFYISKKSLRIMMLKYEDGGIQYRRKFYNHNYAQGTLVPYKSVLWANDKVVEEKIVSTITYGQKVNESIFVHSGSNAL